jgi:death-on-curing protein
LTVWLARPFIISIHDEQLCQHGGAQGIRDEGLLESALARPLNRAGYGAPDMAELAAASAMGIARNHPFVDGNKRTAYVALETFLLLNGIRFAAGDAECVIMTLRMAAGDADEDEFVAWVRANAVSEG